MKKRARRHGKLIQKPKKRVISVTDVQQRHALEGTFRVIAIKVDHTKAWIEGDYPTFREAKEKVDSISGIGVDYYIHSDSSRVLYSKKGAIDA